MRILLGMLLFALFLSGPAHARDGWQGHPVCDAALFSPAQLARCQHWISTVRQPPQPGQPLESRTSCCGEGDAFVVESHATIGGQFFVTVQGKQYLVPPGAVNRASDDGPNQSDEEVAFIWDGRVVCYFPATLT